MISKENIDAIRYATSKEIKFAIASGLTYEDILPIFKEYPDIKFEVIAANGAQYYERYWQVAFWMLRYVKIFVNCLPNII